MESMLSSHVYLCVGIMLFMVILHSIEVKISPHETSMFDGLKSP